MSENFYLTLLEKLKSLNIAQDKENRTTEKTMVNKNMSLIFQKKECKMCLRKSENI
jgi:hypothetical protein